MKLKKGDKVRILGSKNRGMVGVIHHVKSSTYAVDFGGDILVGHTCYSCDDPLPKLTGWCYTEEGVELITPFKVGDRVRYIGNSLAFKGKVGVVEQMDTSNIPAKVEFADGTHWWSALKNLELMTKDKFNKGDRVAMIDIRGEYAGVKIGMVGTVKDGRVPTSVSVEMPTPNDYYVQEKYLEIVPPFKPGDKVTRNFYGDSDVFTVKSIDGDKVWFVKGTWLSSEKLRIALRPAPKFKTGDEVARSWYTDTYTIVRVIWGADEEKFTTHSHYHYYVRGHISPADETSLRLVVEEWVDVTKECTAEVQAGSRGADILVRHGEHVRVILGSKGATRSAVLDGGCGTGDSKKYRVEFTNENWGWAGVGMFKVFKPVSK